MLCSAVQADNRLAAFAVIFHAPPLADTLTETLTNAVSTLSTGTAPEVCTPLSKIDLDTKDLEHVYRASAENVAGRSQF